MLDFVRQLGEVRLARIARRERSRASRHLAFHLGLLSFETWPQAASLLSSHHIIAMEAHL
jgi:hypothetical protein